MRNVIFVAALVLVPIGTVAAQGAGPESGLGLDEVLIGSDPATEVENQSERTGASSLHQGTLSESALIEQNWEKLVGTPGDPVVGPDGAEIVIVEFFDYYCASCRKLTEDILPLVDENPNIRLVFKEFPILGEASVEAARASIAASRHGNWRAFHAALMTMRGWPIEGIRNAADAAGVDSDALEVEMYSPETYATIDRNYKLAENLGITRTPALVFKDEIIFGRLPRECLENLILSKSSGESLDAEAHARCGSGYLREKRPAFALNRHAVVQAVRAYSIAIGLNRSRAHYFSNRGEGWALLGNNELAIEDYASAIQLNPNNVELYMDRSKLWTEQGEPSRAIRDFNAVIRIDPTHVEAYLGRSEAWDEIGEHERSRKDFDRAVRLDLERVKEYLFMRSTDRKFEDRSLAMADKDLAISIDPKDPKSYVSRAHGWLDVGEYERAIDDCNEAIRVDPASYRGYACRGQVLDTTGEYDRATEDFEKVIVLDAPTLRVAGLVCARVHLLAERNEYDHVIEISTRNIELEGICGDEYEWRGLAWFKKGEFDRALEDLHEAIRLDPTNGSAYSLRGMTWVNKGEFDLAIGDLYEAVRLGAGDSATYFNLGLAWFNKGKYRRAIENYSKGISLDPDNARARRNRGEAWLYVHEYDLAIEDYSEALRLDAKDAWAHGNRGLAWAQKGEYDRAIEDYSEAIRLDANDARAYGNRGFARAQKGEYELAIEDYTEVLRRDEEDAWAYHNRGVLLQEMEEYDRAIEDLSEAIRLNTNDAVTYNQLAWILATGPRKHRDGVRAVELAQAGLELADAPYTRHTLAAAWVEVGDFEAAIVEYELALRMGSDLIRQYQIFLIESGFSSVKVSGTYDETTRDSLHRCVRSGCQLGVTDIQ